MFFPISVLEFVLGITQNIDMIWKRQICSVRVDTLRLDNGWHIHLPNRKSIDTVRVFSSWRGILCLSRVWAFFWSSFRYEQLTFYRFFGFFHVNKVLHPI